MDSFQIINSDIKNTSTTSTNGHFTQKLEDETIKTLEKAFIEDIKNPGVNNLSSISNDLVLNNTTTTSTQKFINANKECQNIQETDSNINFDKYCLINGRENYIQKPEDESIPSLEKAFIEEKQNPCANLLSKIKIKKSITRNLFGCFMNFKKR